MESRCRSRFNPALVYVAPPRPGLQREVSTKYPQVACRLPAEPVHTQHCNGLYSWSDSTDGAGYLDKRLMDQWVVGEDGEFLETEAIYQDGGIFDLPPDITNKSPVNKMGWVPPDNFIQWKGTHACVDLHCICGESTHYDGNFLYAWECPYCKQVWKMENSVGMTPVTVGHLDYNGVVQYLSKKA